MSSSVVAKISFLRDSSNRSGRHGAALLKVLCLAYFAGLLWLLLTSDPMGSLRSRPRLWEVARMGAPAAHFVAFTFLALLALAPRWSVPRWAVVLWLVGCAVGTELLQGLVPQRTPELADCLLDLAGIALGVAIFWLGVHWFAAKRSEVRGYHSPFFGPPANTRVPDTRAPDTQAR